MVFAISFAIVKEVHWKIMIVLIFVTFAYVLEKSRNRYYKLKLITADLSEFYKEQKAQNTENSGYDLYVTEDVTFMPYETKFVDHKIKAEMVDAENKSIGYYLYPRSSISKTPLILCNSVGIIDAGYRGNIIAALKYIPTSDSAHAPYVLKRGTRIVQICQASLLPFDVVFVNQLSESKRGAGGFGSSG